MIDADHRGAVGAVWRSARQAGRVAAFGAGSVTLAVAFATGVLFGQAAMARRRIPPAEAPPPRGHGRYDGGHSGRPLTLAVLGDSSAAGYGVAKPRQTPGALLAAGLAARLKRPVHLRTFAVVGATSVTLAPQVAAAVAARPEVAVILVGGNDVTHRISPAVATRHLVQAVRALRAVGAQVVVGTCPDLGTIQPIQPPLRWLAGRWSREMATAQTVAVVESGGATVSLGNLLGPAFAADPHRMFGMDGFHPSAEGYAAAAAAMLPTLVAVVAGDREPRVLTRGEGVRSLPEAAVEAAGTAGTEVIGARVGGREHGPAGRWVQLRRRVRETIWPADPAANGSNTPPAEGSVPLEHLCD